MVLLLDYQPPVADFTGRQKVGRMDNYSLGLSPILGPINECKEEDDSAVYINLAVRSFFTLWLCSTPQNSSGFL